MPAGVIGKKLQASNSTIDAIKESVRSYYTSIVPSQAIYLCSLVFTGGGTGIAIISPNGYSYFDVMTLDYYNGFKKFKYSNGTWTEI